MENYRNKNFLNKIIRILFCLSFIFSIIISICIPFSKSFWILPFCFLIIPFVLYFTIKEKKIIYTLICIFIIYALSLFLILNFYLLKPETIKRNDKKQVERLANLVINEFKNMWNAYIKVNEALYAIAIKDKESSDVSFYELFKKEIRNSKLRNYSFVIFDRYFLPILWINKPKSLLMPANKLQEFSDKPSLVLYGKAVLLISKKELNKDKFIIFELLLQEKAIIYNKYLYDYNFIELPKNVSLIYSKSFKSAPNSSHQEIIKADKEFFIKYHYNFNLPSAVGAASLIITSNSFNDIIREKIFFFSFLNYIILGILLIYFCCHLIKKSSENQSKIKLFVSITLIMWAYRFLLFFIDQKQLQLNINLFDPTNFALKGFFGLFKSAGDFLFTSFIILIQSFIIVLLIGKIIPKAKILKKFYNEKVINKYYFIFSIILSVLVILFFNYYYFSSLLKKIVFNSSKDLTLYFLSSSDKIRFSLLYSLHFLEISLAIFVFFLLFSLFKTCSRLNINKLVLFLLTIIAINFLSYFIRSNYYNQQKQNFLKTNIASMIKEQNKWTYEVFMEALKEVDRSINKNYKEKDLFSQNAAFKIWTKTSFPIYGINSGIDFYNENLNLIDKFSYKVTSYSLAELIKEFPLNSDNNWKVITKMIVAAEKEKSILIGIKKFFDKYFCFIYAEMTYDNLPFVHTRNPYDELFLSPLQYFSEEEQFFPELIVTVYLKNKLLYTNSAKPFPFLPFLIDRDWQKINLDNEEYYAYYFSNGDYIFVIAYPISNISTIIARLIEIIIFDAILFAIALLIFYFFSMLMKKRRYVFLGFTNTFAKKIFIYLIMVAALPISILFISTRNYIIQDRVNHNRLEALNQLQSSMSLITDFMQFNKERYSSERALLNDEIVEWLSETTGYDINIYRDFLIEATSRRELFSSDLLPSVVKGQTYYELYYKRKPFIIENEEIGKLSYYYVASSLEFPNQPFRIIILPVLFSKEKINIELAKFYEKILLTLALIIGLSSLLILVIANRISKPVKSLIAATQMIADGHFEINIPAFKDYEFNTIKNSLELMAKKLNQSLLAIKQRQAYIEAIIANVTDGVIAISLDGKVNLMNEAAKNILDFESNEVINLFELTSEKEALKAFKDLLNKFKKSSLEIQTEQYEVFKEGKTYHYKVSWVPLSRLYSNQDIIILIEDLTDVVISNRLYAWADMAKRVAHEIKNPLTPMQLAIDHLYKVFKSSPGNFEGVLEICYKTITKQINNLKNIVKQFSLFGAEKPSKKNLISLKEFLISIVESYKIHLKDKIEFILEIEEKIPNLNWDIEKMQKVFNNLIENSIQAIETKGIIKIKAYIVGKELKIELSDDGIGMDENTARRLFEPYFTTKDFGTGLGLVIAKKFIEEHNGKITVSTKLGEGTTFYLSFNL